MKKRKESDSNLSETIAIFRTDLTAPFTQQFRQSKHTNSWVAEFLAHTCRKEISKAIVTVAHDIVDVSTQKSFYFLVSNFINLLTKSHKEEMISCALGPLECLVHQVTGDVWEDRNASRT